MKALYFDGHAVRYREDLPIPRPGAGESLIRVLLAAVCNTDREILRGYKPGFTGVMGHEFVGIVEQSDDSSLVGRRVVGELSESCGRCELCLEGRHTHCLSRRTLGMINRDGCFAQHLVLSNGVLHPVPDTLSSEAAIYTEPLAAALEIPEQIHLRPSQRVAVIGDGRLALMVAQVLSLSGAALTVFGRHPEKLERFSPFAQTHLHPSGSFETVVDASGSPEGVRAALTLVRPGGTIVLKSTYSGEASLDLSLVAVNEIRLCGSRCGPFPPALNLLHRGLVRLPEIEFHPLSQYKAAFDSKAFKAGFLISEE